MQNSLKNLSRSLIIGSLVGILIAAILLLLPGATIKVAVTLFAVYLVIVGVAGIVSQSKSGRSRILSYIMIAIGALLFVVPLALPLYVVLLMVAVPLVILGIISFSAGINFIRTKHYGLGVLLTIVGILQLSFVVQAAINPVLAAGSLVSLAGLIIAVWSVLQLMAALSLYRTARNALRPGQKNDENIIEIDQ